MARFPWQGFTPSRNSVSGNDCGQRESGGVWFRECRHDFLGAGFGGLEVASRLSDAFGADADVTLIDKNDGFVFGFSKFELMFGRAALPGVTHRYRDLIRPGVTFRQETIIAIDPVARRVTTDHSTHDADVLVVALGADYDTAKQGASGYRHVFNLRRLSRLMT